MRRKIQLYIWLLPMLLFLAGFVIIPLGVSIFDSFFQVSLLDVDSREFSGIQNYIRLFSDKNVRQAFLNTSFYVVTALTAESVLGILTAVVLKDKFRFRGIIVAILILPWALPPLVNGVIWKLIFDPSIGMLNSVLMRLELIEEPFIWLNNPDISKICVIIVHIWKMLPMISIIFMAKMQTIPEEILEAASLDGSGKFKQFFTMILPNMRGIFLITLIQGSIGAVHLFDEPYYMTGTASDTRSLLIEDYLIAFRKYDLGEGMALAMVISFSLLIMIVLLMILVRRGTKDV